MLRHAGIAVYGPSRAAARIEGSKLFAKDVMAAAGVPTAAVLDAPRAPCVLKADGLAAGKGVVVCRTDEELVAGLVARGFGGPVLVEELLEGPEVSVLALCDGLDALTLAPARDFKRAFDGDTGPNTGGMGSYAPVPDVDEGLLASLLETCVHPTLAELARRGTPFVGTLFAGLMLTADGPSVLEFNCRFGDPETQSVLPLVDGDLLVALAAAARGSLAGLALERARCGRRHVGARCRRVSRGGRRGDADRGLDDAAAQGALVFHAGTALKDGSLVTNGGTVARRDRDGRQSRRGPERGLRGRRPDPDPRRPSPRGHRARGGGGRSGRYLRFVVGHPIPPPTSYSIVRQATLAGGSASRVRATCQRRPEGPPGATSRIAP